MAITTTLEYTIDLDKSGLRETLRSPLYTLNSKAHVFSLAITQGGAAASMTGAVCKGWFVRADGVTVPIDGKVSGSTATVTLLPSCYAVQGRFELSVDLTMGDVIHTVLHVDGSILRTRTDSLTSGGGPVQSFDELLSAFVGHENALSVRDRVYNLLDNSYFADCINQRGASSYTGTVYGVDRWYGRSVAQTMLPRSADVTVTATGAAYVGIKQKVLNIADYAGKTLTFACSVYATAAPRLRFSDANDTELAGVRGVIGQQLLVLSLAVPADATPDSFVPTIMLETAASGDYMRLYWAALYEGAYTAANLPAYVPKGYAAEMAECQRYYHVYATEAARPENGMDASPPMRLKSPTKGTVTIGGATCYFNSADL